MATKIPLPQNLKHCLIQFVKNKQNQRVGVLVAIPDPGAHLYRIGYSKCNMWAERFNRERALEIAFGRAQANCDLTKMPKSWLRNGLYHQFMDRCDRYYKEDKIAGRNEAVLRSDADMRTNDFIESLPQSMFH